MRYSSEDDKDLDRYAGWRYKLRKHSKQRANKEKKVGTELSLGHAQTEKQERKSLQR